MQCSLSPSPVPTLHIGCKPSQHYTHCIECPNAVPLGRIFRSAGLFAAVPTSHKNSSNGKDHVAEKKKQYAEEHQPLRGPEAAVVKYMNTLIEQGLGVDSRPLRVRVAAGDTVWC